LTADLATLGITSEDRGRVAHVPDPRYDEGRPLGGTESKVERSLTANLSSWLAVPVLHTQANSALVTAVHAIGNATFSLRRSWVRAISSRQALNHAEDAVLAAQVISDLTQRLRDVGSAPAIDVLRAQQFLEQAMARKTEAQAEAQLQREQLLHAMGIWGIQAQAVRLPSHLPELPASSLGAEGLEALAVSQRLDVQIARAMLSRHDSAAADGNSGPHAELDVAGMRARAELRTAWIAYQAKYALARHACNVEVPLAQRVLEEQTKRYNAMLVGVFELITDAIGRSRAVSNCLAAQSAFWLADVDLQQALAGIGSLPQASGAFAQQAPSQPSLHSEAH
jgi:outer membrane protein TolC